MARGNGASICQALVVAEQIIFCDLELKVEDVEVLSLDTAHVPFAEDACAHGPVDVLQSRIVEILRGYDQRAEEYALKGPLLETDVEVWTSPVDVYEGGKKGGHGDLCALKYVVDECGELLRPTCGGPSAGGRGSCSAHSIVDCLYDTVDCVFNDLPVEFDVNELKKRWTVERGIYETCVVDGGRRGRR